MHNGHRLNIFKLKINIIVSVSLTLNVTFLARKQVQTTECFLSDQQSEANCNGFANSRDPGGGREVACVLMTRVC